MLVERIFVQIFVSTFLAPPITLQQTVKTKIWQNDLISHFDLENQYALVIARFQEQYDKYFPSFSYFANLLHVEKQQNI